jgi:hypothetical protein
MDYNDELIERPGADVSVDRYIDECITNVPSLYEALVVLDMQTRRLNVIKKIVHAKGRSIMRNSSVDWYEGQNGIAMTLATEKKDVFDNGKIYDFYSTPDGLREALPKNPDFKKTVLKRDMGEDGFREVCQTVEIQDIKLGKVKDAHIKLVDTKYLT